MAKTEATAESLTVFQENLANLERSLSSIVHYLNSHTLPERVEQLEQSYAQLKQQIIYFSEQQTEDADTPLAQTELSAPVSQLPAPALNLSQTSSSPTPTASNWRLIHTLIAHAEVVASVAISPDSRFLASASWDQNLKLWDLKTGRLINQPVGHSQGILAIVFIGHEDRANDYQIATGSFDQTIKIWSLVPEREDNYSLDLNQALIAHTGSIHALAFAPKHQILLSGSYDQTIKQWNPETGKMLSSSYDASGAIYAIAVNEQAQFIASAGGDGRVTLWQLETGKELGWLAGNISSVESLAISPDGRTLAAGCVDGTIKLWQLESSLRGSRPIRILDAHAGQVKSLVFSRDGQTLLSSGADGTIKTWHPSSIQAIDTLSTADESTSRLSPVFSLALSSDGQILAAGSADGKIRVWQQGC
jgi:WD40 repeat protein